MTKPFNVQSPEAIAKDYAGNKQQIASAIQMGLVDPTSGVLAGMFIDRMRMAQSQEQAPQQTVAQQVFNPGGGAPQGGMSQGAVPPQQGTPPQQAQQNPGVAGLPLPEGAFNQRGFAGGGIVAFSEGGYKVPDNTRSRLLKQIENLKKHGFYEQARIMQEQFIAMERGELGPADVKGGDRSPYNKREYIPTVPGAVADNVSRIAKEGTQYGLGLLDPNPQGSEFTESVKAGVRYPFEMLGKVGNALQGPYGRAVDFFASPEGEGKERYANYNYWKNYDPNAGAPYGPQQPLTMPEMEPEMDQQPPPAMLGGLGALSQTSTSTPGAPVEQTPFDREAHLNELQRLMGGSPQLDALSKYYDEQGGRAASQKKEDLWSALAQFGFGMASSQSPHFLQAAGEAGSGIMPMVQDSIKGRRAAEEKAVQARADIEGVKRGEKRGLLTDTLTAEQKEKDRAHDAQLERDRSSNAMRIAAETRGPTQIQERIALYTSRPDVYRALFGDANQKLFASVYSDMLQTLSLDTAYQKLRQDDPEEAERYLVSRTKAAMGSSNIQRPADIDAIFSDLGL